MVFSYASTAHERRHGPRGYLSYRSYKPWLRDEFVFRCVYCLLRERWCHDGADGFGVDHHRPKTRYPELECEYDNLLYACNRCNSWKREQELAIDPCSTGLGAHIRVRRDGVIEGLSSDGAFLIEVLELNDDKLTIFRKRYMDLIDTLDPAIPEEAELLADISGFPADLPDLQQLHPPRATLVRRESRAAA